MSVTITITEGPEGLVVRVEADPPLPMPRGDLDVDALTLEQGAAILGAQAITDAAGSSEWRSLIR